MVFFLDAGAIVSNDWLLPLIDTLSKHPNSGLLIIAIPSSISLSRRISLTFTIISCLSSN